MAAAILVPVAAANAGIVFSGSFNLPSPVAAGQTGVAGSFTIINTNTSPNQAQSNTLTSLRMAPSCGSAPFINLCPTPDPGVFAMAPTATGAAGTACNGTTFTVSPPDSSGVVTLTPSAPVVLGPPGGQPVGSDRCTVNFSFNALRVPNIDANPGSQEVQTQFSVATSTHSFSQQITVVRATPTLTTSATNATIGQPIRDTATLTGGASPTGTVTFFLYSDPTCATQIFMSINPVSAASATSTDFTPTAPGSYYWRAQYSGDTNNNAVPLTPCNAPGETSVVTPAGVTPPGNPPALPGVPPAPPAGTRAAAQAPDQGLVNCATAVTVGRDGTVKLCDATNPPTASTSQTLTGTLPARLAATAAQRRRRRPVTVGRGQTTIPAGQTKPVVAKLTAKAKRALAKRGRLTVVAEIEAKGADGQTATVKKTVSLKAAKKKRKRR